MKKNRDFNFEIKAVKKGGFIAGYASVFNVIDSYRERVLPHAFDESLAETKAQGRKIPILLQHRDLIGAWEVVEPDDIGLYVETHLPVDKVRQASEAHALAMDGALTGISIGWEDVESELDKETGIRDLIKIKLYECSLVTFPANDPSRILEVRSKLANGETPTIRELENSLRDLGFSKSQAAGIVAKGYQHFVRDAGSDESNIAALLEKMRAFSLSK